MKLAMITDGTVSADIRLVAYKLYFEKVGYQVGVVDTEDIARDKRIPVADIVMIARPSAPQLIEEYQKRGARVIADMDDDFWSIPKTHVGYNYVGAGAPLFLEAMEQSLSLVDHITVSTEVIADRLARFGRPISIIHNGWNDNNKNWFQPKRSLSKKIIIGWAGTITHREDFAQVVSSLVAITRKYPDVGILIGSDPEIYKLLRKIPDSNKWFVPMFPYELYPLLFRYIDIWIAPLVNNKFNEAKSDIKLVEGSAKGLPSVVSPVPAYIKWNGSTVYAKDEHEWTVRLEELINSPELRKRLGDEQKDKAQSRATSLIAKDWLRLLK